MLGTSRGDGVAQEPGKWYKVRSGRPAGTMRSLERCAETLSLYPTEEGTPSPSLPSPEIWKCYPKKIP